MDAIAATQIVKLLIALLLVVASFLFIAFLARYKLRISKAHKHIYVLENIFLNNKDRLLRVRVNEHIYLIFINASSSLLLHTETFSESNDDTLIPANSRFQTMLSNLYSK